MGQIPYSKNRVYRKINIFIFSCVRMACMPIYVYCTGVYAHLEPRVFYLLY